VDNKGNYPSLYTFDDITRSLTQTMRSHGLEEALADSFSIGSISGIFPRLGKESFVRTALNGKKSILDKIFYRTTGYFSPNSFKVFLDRNIKWIQNWEPTASYAPTSEDINRMLIEASATYHGSISYGNLEEEFRPRQIEKGNKLIGKGPLSESMLFGERLGEITQTGHIAPQIFSKKSRKTPAKNI